VVWVLQARAGQAAVHDVREPPLHPGTVARRVTETLGAAHIPPCRRVSLTLDSAISRPVGESLKPWGQLYPAL